MLYTLTYNQNGSQEVTYIRGRKDKSLVSQMRDIIVNLDNPNVWFELRDRRNNLILQK